MSNKKSYTFHNRRAFCRLINLPSIANLIQNGEIVIYSDGRWTLFLGENNYKYCRSASIYPEEALALWNLCRFD